MLCSLCDVTADGCLPGDELNYCVETEFWCNMYHVDGTYLEDELLIFFGLVDNAKLW